MSTDGDRELAVWLKGGEYGPTGPEPERVPLRLFHVEDGGLLEEIGQVNLEGAYGPVARLRCTVCGSEMDVSDYDRIARMVDGVLVDYKGNPVGGSAS